MLLEEIFHNRFNLDTLENVDANSFIRHITQKLNTINSQNYLMPEKQRDLSLKFHWGHDHDFGKGFILRGNMKNRHINIIDAFISDYGLSADLSGRKVLDIGVWTGGTSLLLTALGADVDALEEVPQYSEMVNYLSYAFGIENKLRCYSMSLYDFLPMFADYYDFIIYSGVIYHVSDPLLSLRLIFSALKNDGSVFIETLGNDDDRSICIYEGTSVYTSGTAEKLNRTGWNYFIPTRKCLENWCYDAGFQKVDIGQFKNRRILGTAQRLTHTDICRAGLSKTNVR